MMHYKENKPLAKKLNIVAYIASAVVLIAVGVMRRVHFDVGIDFSFLPLVNSIINTIVFILLIIAGVQIKKKNIEAHKKYMIAAMVMSTLFLLCYIVYHVTTEATPFCKEGWIRSVYFVILISHVVLAGVSFPFILFSFVRGISYQIEKHRKLVKYVYPVWLYVALTGPIVYLLLRSCY